MVKNNHTKRKGAKVTILTYIKQKRKTKQRTMQQQQQAKTKKTWLKIKEYILAKKQIANLADIT